MAGFARVRRAATLTENRRRCLIPRVSRPEGERVSSVFRLSRYFVVLSAVWVLAIARRLYPQFKDTLSDDGRLVTLAAYIKDMCGQRSGPEDGCCPIEV